MSRIVCHRGRSRVRTGPAVFLNRRQFLQIGVDVNRHRLAKQQPAHFSAQTRREFQRMVECFGSFRSLLAAQTRAQTFDGENVEPCPFRLIEQ